MYFFPNNHKDAPSGSVIICDEDDTVAVLSNINHLLDEQLQDVMTDAVLREDFKLAALIRDEAARRGISLQS